ncbi:FMP52 [Candida oxycetoniae]|uniref:FMP52 n=1 Tax=Candida oxycetoniae TaxID=497107 RepID=A0AAI9STU9_9ASCO|nr:FMP52 [Candida oxycetoniae]KAI3402703.2 FMP52 [Candida oxycetoniae]
MSGLFILGSTGLVGSQTVKYGLESKEFDKVVTVTRSLPDFATDSKVDSIVESDTSKWSDIIHNIKPSPLAFISAFGTTRAKAGSAEKFKEIDYGINYESAKAAKANGAKVCVLVSAYGASATSLFLYMKTKGELEDAIIDLKFDYTIILKPGVLIGERKEDHGLGNSLAMKVGKWVQGTWLSPLVQPIDASDVGRLAIDFAERGLKGDLKESVLKVGAPEMIKLAENFKSV